MEVIPQLSFSEAFNNVTSKIFQFTGRSRRSEYWWTMALVYLLNIILTPFLGVFLSIATIPLTFRRLHDTGRSGWWWVLVRLCRSHSSCRWFTMLLWLAFTLMTVMTTRMVGLLRSLPNIPFG